MIGDIDDGRTEVVIKPASEHVVVDRGHAEEREAHHAVLSGAGDRRAPVRPVHPIAYLVEHWETMSGHYLHDRERLVSIAVEWLVGHLGGRCPTVVELGSGPGALLHRLGAELPGARMIGVELDPVLCMLCDLGAAGDPARQPEIVVADLRDEEWASKISDSADAVVAVQVLHYLSERDLIRVLGEVHDLLGAGGVFVHLDRVPERNSTEASPVDGVASTGDDPWAQWWSLARQEPLLSVAVGHRDHWLSTVEFDSAEHHPDDERLLELLTEAGFDPIQQSRSGNSLLTIASARSAG